MSLPILYSGTKNASSWAMRAWLALKHADVHFQEVVVDIRRPQRFEHLRALASLSPSATVPLLVIDGRSIFDSLAIMEFANDYSSGALLPEDSVARAQARSVAAWQHAGLSSICGRISFESAFYPLKRPLSEVEQQESARLFGYVEELLMASGGPFLFGELSLADLSLVPAVVRLTRHDVNLERFAHAQEWTRRMFADPYVKEWMEVADPLPHIWFDDYLDGPVPDRWAAQPRSYCPVTAAVPLCGARNRKVRSEARIGH